MSSSDKIKSEWLKSFFDDEAYVSKIDRRIVLNTVNKRGLVQIQKLLNDLGIKSWIGGPYKYKKYQSYHLKIYRPYLKKYKEIIGFNHPKKQSTLLEIINGDAEI